MQRPVCFIGDFFRTLLVLLGVVVVLVVSWAVSFDTRNKTIRTTSVAAARKGHNHPNNDYDSGDPRPRGLRLFLMGDSLTRYHYLSLTHFLLHGRWVDETRAANLEAAAAAAANGILWMDDPKQLLWNPLKRTTISETDWNVFFQATTRSGYEICDCCRIQDDMTTVRENRYFYEPVLDNLVTLLLVLQKPQGVVDPANMTKQELANASVSSSYHKIPSVGTCIHWTWQFDGFAPAIQHVARRLPLCPTHVLMNRGLWTGHWFAGNSSRQDDLVDALLMRGQEKKNNNEDQHNSNCHKPMVGIWRTTTATRGRSLQQQYQENSESDDVTIARLFARQKDQRLLILNVSWTQRVHASQYWDDRHFWEPTYRVMSEDLFTLLGHSFPANYNRFDRSRLFSPFLASDGGGG